ncbi:MAG: polyprenol monophosphomannose synthase [bacterium]
MTNALPQRPLAPLHRVLVIIPTYNESDGILSLIAEILPLDARLEILVVDDNSPDGTADLIEQTANSRVHLRRRQGKLGYASASLEGFRWAVQNDYDAALEMDADRSHDPHDIPLLLQALEQGAHVAIGSRYLNGVRVLNWPLPRLLLSAGGGFYVRFLTGLPLTDPTSGFKALRSEVIRLLKWTKFTSEGYSFNIETYYFAWKQRFKLVEIPIIFTERRQGASKMTPQIAIEAALRVIKLALRRLIPAPF